MPDRPPSPRPPFPSPSIAAPSTDPASERRVVLTTSQLAEYVASLGVHLDESALEDLLLELDREGYVEWATVTRDGEYAWDLTASPDRIAEAFADAAVSRLESWLAGPSDD